MKGFIEDRINTIQSSSHHGEEQDYIEQVFKNHTGEVTEEFVRDLVDDFSLFFAAGVHTTSITSFMMLNLISRHP